MRSMAWHQHERDADALLTIRLSTPTPETYRKAGKEYGTFMPRGGGKITDPVAATAARRDRLLRDVRMIEQAAQVAAGDLAGVMLHAVTRRGGVQAVLARERPPIGERQFYAMRRKFFWVLREMRNGEWE